MNNKQPAFVGKEEIFTSEKIREIRESLSLSRCQFAKYLHITPQTIYDWEVKG